MVDSCRECKNCLAGDEQYCLKGNTLLVVCGIVAFEPIRRLIHPPTVAGGPVLVVALVGVMVNIAAAWVLAKATDPASTSRGAYQHILTDLYGFIGTVVTGAGARQATGEETVKHLLSPHIDKPGVGLIDVCHVPALSSTRAWARGTIAATLSAHSTEKVMSWRP